MENAEDNLQENPALDSAEEPVDNPSYRRKEPLIITERIRRQIAGAVAEIDLAQMAIVAKLTPAERVEMALSIIDACEEAGVYRLRQRELHLSEDEALRIVRGGLLSYYRGRNPWPEKNSPL